MLAVSFVSVAQATEINVADYFPMEVGRMWTYTTGTYSVTHITVTETRDFTIGVGYVFKKNKIYTTNLSDSSEITNVIMTNEIYGGTNIGIGKLKYESRDRDYSITYYPCLLMLPMNPQVGESVINPVTVTHIGEYIYSSRPWSQ
ncbi:MAG: hypothetical protein AAB956_01445, partial [Patescibacteria group bacterium]